jgi:glycerol-3-phosphate dehydrogenase subunit B
MDDILVIGAGPAGLVAAWAARQRGAQVRVLATGIGTTHVSPGWIGVLNGGNLQATLQHWITQHPHHPYALAGLDALQKGVALFRQVCADAELNYVGDLASNFKLPTALGAIRQAALVPASFAAGDVRKAGAMLIAAPAGWRDFYPAMCAENLARHGVEARGVTFDLPELHASSQFDATSVGLARLFDRADVRQRVAAQLRPQLGGAGRVGLPAVLGLERSTEAWQDLQDRLGVPVFEIATLPPCVPGIRLYNVFKQALTHAGVQILLEMTVARGTVENGRVASLVVPNIVREKVYHLGQVILATGGLYGGGIATDASGAMREAIFNLPLHTPGEMGQWFNEKFMSDSEHPLHHAGVRVNTSLQPVDEQGNTVIENVRVAGRLLAGYNPLAEGSSEGVILATAYRAACL